MKSNLIWNLHANRTFWGFLVWKNDKFERNLSGKAEMGGKRDNNNELRLLKYHIVWSYRNIEIS